MPASGGDLMRITAICLLALVACAQQPVVSLPNISPGREGEIVALFSPYWGSEEIVAGWKISGIDVERTTIRVRVTGPGDAGAGMVLQALDTFAGGRMTPDAASDSFALRFESAGPESRAALVRLAQAVRDNDAGTFWNEAPRTEVRPKSLFLLTFTGTGAAFLGLGLGAWLALAIARRRLTRRHRAGLALGASAMSLTGLAHFIALPAGAVDLHAVSRHLPAAGELLLRLAGDGVLLLTAAIVLLLLLVRRQTAESSPRIRVALFGVFVVAFLLRLGISVEAPMTADPYSRVVPIVSRMWFGEVLLLWTRVTGGEIALVDLVFWVNLLMAALSPIVLFAHARFVLKDDRAALVAAALLAVLPHHLRFSRSDALHIQGLAVSSLTFALIYSALTDHSSRWRKVCLAALVPLCLSTYFVRPEHLVFVALDLGAILLARTQGVPLKRLVAALTIVAGTGLAAFVNVLHRPNGDLAAGLSLDTLRGALTILTRLELNALLNPAASPPGILLMAAIGTWWLWKNQRGRAVFLWVWLSSFFLVYAYAVHTKLEMQSRYQLNLITPLIFLAAAATPLLLRMPVWGRVVVAAYLISSPLLHRSFIENVDFTEMREFAFLREATRQIPDGCTVLEFNGVMNPAVPDAQHRTRVGRFSERIRGGRHVDAWQTIPIAHLRPEGDGQDEELTDEVRSLVQTPPDCLMYYEGMTCRTQRRAELFEAPACREMRENLDRLTVASTSFVARIYDDWMASRRQSIEGEGIVSVHRDPRFARTMGPWWGGVVDGDTLNLTLYRARQPSGDDGRRTDPLPLNSVPGATLVP